MNSKRRYYETRADESAGRENGPKKSPYMERPDTPHASTSPVSATEKLDDLLQRVARNRTLFEE